MALTFIVIVYITVFLIFYTLLSVFTDILLFKGMYVELYTGLPHLKQFSRFEIVCNYNGNLFGKCLDDGGIHRIFRSDIVWKENIVVFVIRRIKELC